LYRTNSQSRAFEEALRRQGIDYRIYGGMSFYQRKEVKDLISYLRLVINPSDEEALKRVINYPGRGIGDTTINRIVVKSSELGVPLWDVVASAGSIPELGVSAGKVENFAMMIKSFQTMLDSHNAYDLAMHVAKQTGLLKLLYDDKSVEGVSRYENITELLNGIQEFVEDDESEKEKTLANFLEDVALYTDDQKDKDPDRDCVSLMTIHASKGLEYPVVFIVGIEENLFPSQLSLHSRADLEEERRLFYVAITRAETKCYLTFATSRFKYGSLVPCEPSRFIQEIDPQYLDMSTASLKSASPFGGSGGGDFSGSGYIGGQYASRKVEDKPTKTAKLFSASKPPSPPVPPADPNFVEGDISGLKVGDKVQHQRFGFGVVVSIEGDAASAKAIVNFDQMGQKTLVLKFAKMRIV
jgi:DNA helicase-2/ATP-dependent DNA helicase PcrA